ncbi:IS66-like element accessory protein TnpA [Paracoccus aerius]|uniref:Transposase n=1 Tax=Paracoccus aerius TaxID=1915382 RepID=A0ABS1SBX0_9RHOB|nr:transposase [Paracoccus aerius]MBL3675745.1 transposase [Paracoccus aerius]GHG36621.1 transposase [Paracoccus aerius]
MRDLKFEPPIEVLSAADGVRRRHWSDADKVRIVEESLTGKRQVSATARRHDISRSLLTVWRRQNRTGELGGDRLPSFMPLTVSAELPGTMSPRPVPPNPEARVEIALRNGRQLVVPANVDPEALARLLSVVDGR